jgi:uncharacterized protein with HEPN domain
MRREFGHILHDITEAIGVIETATAGKTFSDYQADKLLRLASERAIEIISEAGRGIPDNIQQMRPEIPWRKIRGIGNVLRHEYAGLSNTILWGVIQDELPRLRLAITALTSETGQK